ncbi:ABC transporter ATP-binding protein [Ensifer sp. ENS06]|uniref:ABC transporter ATP-binding protein n=1 Tax=Ensifer sp. ENS06 TaxID=2769276 RepID=UPI001781DCB6|nr:ABC transporter ATP-binding protein [Ensifer sp. ENS06]MBD9628123.1 ABC transporter ATP-binding protein [Ensifer sp. ENS06]
MLTLESMSCGYGSIVAASNISFSVDQGEILALIGPNGAGKTSTIMATMGHVRVTGGAIRVDGRDITRESARRRPHLGVAVVPEGRRLFNELTVEENLTVGGYICAAAVASANMERVYSLFPRLAERRRQIAGSMSGGEQQMLAIGRALMTSPKVLLVDELSLGLMPKIIDLCLETIVGLKKEGMAIVLVEQNTDRALDVADRAAVLSSGRLVVTGAPSDLRSRESFFEDYLGLDIDYATTGDAQRHV